MDHRRAGKGQNHWAQNVTFDLCDGCAAQIRHVPTLKYVDFLVAKNWYITATIHDYVLYIAIRRKLMIYSEI